MRKSSVRKEESMSQRSYFSFSELETNDSIDFKVGDSFDWFDSFDGT